MHASSEPNPILADVEAVATATCDLTWSTEPRPDRLGLEVEALPVSTSSNPPDARLPLVRVTEIAGSAQPDTGSLTFEPGGQIELSTAPGDFASVLEDAGHDWRSIEEAFESRAAALVPLGLDPWHSIDDVPQQLDAGRYLAMDRFFAHSWPSGQGMMRNTCSLQVNLDASVGEERRQRWLAANLMSPILTAMFSTSPGDGGIHCQRARIWQEIDPSRTGLPRWDGLDSLDPEDDSLRRALGANVMFVNRDGKTHPVAPGWTFYDWVSYGHAEFGPPRVDDLATHLTTLFHEVRARNGVLEIRAIDALPRRWWTVPVVMTAALLYDETARGQMIDLLEPYVTRLESVWRHAAIAGLTDPEIGSMALKLARLASETACRDALFNAASVHRLDEFIERFTLRCRAPSDEVRNLAHDPSRLIEWAIAESDA